MLTNDIIITVEVIFKDFHNKRISFCQMPYRQTFICI